MNGYYYRFLEFYKRLIHGIAFVPFLITLNLAFLSILFLSLETYHAGTPALTLWEYIQVENSESARAILTGILSAMISLTVFGFSMMMLVVNQSSSNYSPKVVDTLINNRSNQFILGIYLGTIVFTLITLMQLDNEKISNGVPRITVFFNVALGIYSIILFVKFINNISNSVRIGSIAERLYLKTESALRNQNKYHCSNEAVSTEGWISHPAHKYGYFQIIKVHQLLAILKKQNLMLKVIPYPGYYLTQRTPLFSLNKQIDEKVLSNIRNCFICYTGEDIKENEFYGFRQLREVAVKALSPGINDPGVARICIDYIGGLLSIVMDQESKTAIEDDKGDVRILLNKYEFETLLGICFTPIKAYGKKDYTVLNSLLHTLLDLSLYDPQRQKKDALNSQANSILEEIEQHIINSIEIDFLNATISDLNKTGYFSLGLIKKKLM